MQITFGIVTTAGNEGRISKIVDSIIKNNIPRENHEVVVVGNIDESSLPASRIAEVDISIVSFDDSVRNGWITKKKNLITKRAKFDNIVYMHDYLYFDEDWYKNMVQFGNDWDVMSNRQVNLDGTRFRDWCLWPGRDVRKNPYVESPSKCLLPYNTKHLSKFMYLSGGYWVAKKHVMNMFPLDEKLVWGEGEDVEWSKRVRQQYEFTMNENSIVYLGKHKAQHFQDVDPEYIKKIDKEQRVLYGE